MTDVHFISLLGGVRADPGHRPPGCSLGSVRRLWSDAFHRVLLYARLRRQPLHVWGVVPQGWQHRPRPRHRTRHRAKRGAGACGGAVLDSGRGLGEWSR
jgi:hypothetical protein